MKSFKQLLRRLLRFIFIAVPVVIALVLLVPGHGWWVSILAALGVLLLVSLLVSVIVVAAAKAKAKAEGEIMEEADSTEL